MDRDAEGTYRLPIFCAELRKPAQLKGQFLNLTQNILALTKNFVLRVLEVFTPGGQDLQS
jgi:hypothetical protein